MTPNQASTGRPQPPTWEHVERLEARVKRLEDILRDLQDPYPCRLDHHGYCQEHDWMDSCECVQPRIKAALADSPEPPPPRDDLREAIRIIEDLLIAYLKLKPKPAVLNARAWLEAHP